MSENTTATEKAKASGAKTPADRKKAASAKVKAMQAEATEGDVIVELHGETYTVHLAEFQRQVQKNYEFQEIMTTGLISPLLKVLLSDKDHEKLKESVRDKDSGEVDTERMTELFQELTEAAGQGN